ncbi:PQQ-binding-like beta-propeller repeat protein [Microbulbifer sp. CAU 1566]|uniref:outer membrane protein assembly factor BamB family protein n=1 Tax=Microbulbifer sp. CAU 1566 TaxID=2933269 RepID=UPI002004F919|nr:PQQ-binding-like beta-propeller repeat protein [Microbulbifer sp. CAU 1566]MCK7598969.1 PQQ-binding-like beta-propeller repeat protein [Microbulbifer sp. CAU 1566]
MSDTSAPETYLDFPHLDGLWVEGEYATIRGRAEDESEIKSIAVNGQSAWTEDDYRTWMVTIPVSEEAIQGAQTHLSIRAEDIHGNISEVASPRVLYSHIVKGGRLCGRMNFDRNRGTFLDLSVGVVETSLDPFQRVKLGDFTNKNVLRFYSSVTQGFYSITREELRQITPNGDEGDLVSSHGQNDVYFSWVGIPVPDDTLPRAFFFGAPPGDSEADLESIYAIDLYSGERSRLSGPFIGNGPAISEFDILTVSNGRVFVVTDDAEASIKGLAEIDLDSGDRVLISSESIGSGHLWDFATGLAVDENAGKAYITDLGNDLVEVDIATGDRKVLSASSTSAHSNLVFEQNLGLAASVARGAIYISSCQANHLLAVDIESGERSQVSPSLRGAGPTVNRISDVAYDPANNRIITLNKLNQLLPAQLMTIDPVSGDRKVLSGEYVGAGVDISFYSGGLTVDELTGEAYVFSTLRPEIIKIDPISGARSMVLAGAGSEASLIANPTSLFVSGALKTLYVGDAVSNALIGVDLVSGEEFVVSAPGSKGLGESWVGLTDIALSEDQRTLYVSDYEQETIFRVDLESGDRTILSSPSIGSGESLRLLRDITLDPTRNQLVVNANSTYAPLVFVDVETGDREFRYFSADWRSHDDLTVDPNSGRIYFVQGFTNLVAVYDYEARQAFTLSQ